MGTTTNNGWPTPVATDLVKDGWEAIKDLGDAIDTTLGVYAPSTSGLTLINTTSFSGVSSQSVNDVFSATYDRYLLVVSQTKATTTGSMYLRLRVSGTDATGTDYKYHFSYGESLSGTYSGIAANTDTGLRLTVDNSTTDIQSANVTLFNPFAAAKTSILGTTMNFAGSTAGGQFAGGHNLTTSYTGFTIYNSGGTMTGSINLYAFNK
jgi:hypothetical protein